MKTATLSVLALAAFASPAAAQSQSVQAAPSLSVAYSDLDLSSAGDAAVMLKRIQATAARVCRQGPNFAGNDAETLARIDACRRQAVAAAVEGLNAPRVTQTYLVKPQRQQLARRQ